MSQIGRDALSVNAFGVHAFGDHGVLGGNECEELQDDSGHLDEEPEENSRFLRIEACARRNDAEESLLHAVVGLFVALYEPVGEEG